MMYPDAAGYSFTADFPGDRPSRDACPEDRTAHPAIRRTQGTSRSVADAPSGNPKNIIMFQDLTRPELNVVVCAPQVPCGSATQKVEQNTGVQLTPVSEESSVTDVLNKVETGQADAGLVYITDTLAAGDKVTSVPFPESVAAVNVYPISVLKQSKNPELARKFVDLVISEAGQKILAAAGFTKP